MLKIRIKSTHFIPVSFLITIIIGTILLLLPFASAQGKETDIVTALFTATTSVCVTGLVVVDTYAHWSLFGQLVILLLVQIGGLGVVAVGSMIMLAGKRKFSLSNRMLLGDSLNVDESRGLMSFLTRVFQGVFLVEGIGAVLYAIRFIPMLGVGNGLWASLFQSVSAFCNAGMDVVGPNSMMDFQDSVFLMTVTMLLIVMGGIGFVVWFDIIDGIKNGIKNRMHISTVIRHLSEHTKIVLIMTFVLLAFGTVCVLTAEYDNPATIGNMDLGGKLLNSLFQSVTFRTAGFASVPQDQLTELSCVTGYILMFIGGSPVGTAGGVKTVTAFLVFMNAFSYIRGKKENVVFSRRVSEELMRKAAAVVFVSMCAVLVMTMLLL
ncbi:MAG: potassium transporter TrkH, partial [Lachnospiraceae bacterium]|nr:potassium transporter TrkH [Lachnospiraceae bacterium]